MIVENAEAAKTNPTRYILSRFVIFWIDFAVATSFGFLIISCAVFAVHIALSS